VSCGLDWFGSERYQVIEDGVIMDLPSLQIRLIHDLGLLPAHIALSVPVAAAYALIRKRFAIPVGDLTIPADVVIEQDELHLVGIGYGY